MLETYINPSRDQWEALCARPSAANPTVRARVEAILQRVREQGDDALRALSEEIDGRPLGAIEVSPEEILEAEVRVSGTVKRAVAQAEANIRAFHEAQRPREVSVETAPGVVVERGVTRENLTALLRSDHYAVARISCLRDTSYAEGRPEAALKATWGDVWYDGDGRAWLDPAAETTRTYLTALCAECARLGFDEILLDGFWYPVSGNQEALALPEGLNKTAALTELAAAIRQVLPENVALSVAYRSEAGALGGGSGLTAELLSSFDRIYVDEAVDRSALDQALPQTFDRSGGLALLCYGKPESGGYAILP
jgi:hypothetical protein